MGVHRHRRVHGLDIRFFYQYLTSLEAEPLDLFLGYGFTSCELVYLPVRSTRREVRNAQQLAGVFRVYRNMMQCTRSQIIDRQL